MNLLQKSSNTLRSILIAGSCLFVCASAKAQTRVTTYHYDIARTGANTNETTLTPANVNTNTFGKLFSLPVDGWVYPQPLYMPGVVMGAGTVQAGTTHNVLFVATEHDSVYAFDADNNLGANANPLWKASLIDTGHGAGAGEKPVPNGDVSTGDIVPEIGIVSTPVIDPATNTIYVVAKSTVGDTTFIQRLHALDITTGKEKFGGPVVLSASVPGTGNGSSGGVLNWDPKWQMNRASLLLLNGIIYIGFGSHGDNGPWHGWILAYNASTLAPTGAWSTSPNSLGSGIWGGGAGFAADVPAGKPFGRIFAATGNGLYDATAPNYTNSANYGDSIVKLDLANGVPTMNSNGTVVGDAFTPVGQVTLNNADEDQGSGGVMLLPDSVGGGGGKHQLVQVGKSAIIYVLDRENLGGYSPNNTNDPQEAAYLNGGLWGLPAYWSGNVFVWGVNDNLKAFSFANGVLSANPTSTAAESSGSYSPTPTVSANGTSNGIVWTVKTDNYAAQARETLYAHDASNVGHLLYSSDQNSARDNPGNSVKFITPMVANGKVYVGSESQVSVFGLLGGAMQASAPIISPASQSFSSTLQVTITDSTTGATIYYTTDGSTPTTASHQYTAPFTVSTTTTVNAIAAGTGLLSSSVASATYTLSTQVVMPSFNPPAGLYSAAQSVAISTTTPNASIYYTTDGTTPSTASLRYTAPVTVSVTEILSAMAVASGLSNSPLASGLYTIDTAASGINFSSGFASGSITLLGSAKLSGTALRLTDAVANEAAAAWYPVPANVDSFTTDFTFLITPGTTPTADGLAFVIQENNTTAIGPSGGGLGYGPDATTGTPGIGNSVAIKFDLYSNGGEGLNSTGMYINGASPTVPAVDMTGSGVDLHSGHPMHVHVVYDGTNLVMTATDTTTNAFFSHSWPIDIPGTVGDTVAYVGFTGGTGGLTAIQDIQNWTYNSGISPVAPNIMTPPSSQTVAAGLTATFTVVAGGTLPLSYQWQKNSTNITGATAASYTTPATTLADSGSTYQVVVSNTAGSVTSTAATLTVNSGPAFTSSNSTTFVTGSTGTFAVTATGIPAPSLTEVGALPSGVTFVDNGNGTATLSGTPAAGMGGTYTLTFTASNGVGSPATQSFSLKVNQAPAITSANSTTFTVGTAGSFTVTTTGNPLAVVTETGALPSGVSFVNNGNGTATLSGTPASGSGGTYVVTLTANNGVGTAATQSFTLTVNGGGGGGGSSNFAYVTGSITGVIDSSGSSSKTLAVALHQNPGAGHLLICAGTWQSATATATMSDPNNGVWTAIGTAKTGVGSLGGYRGQMFYVPSAVNKATTATLTISSPVKFRAFECAEYSYSGTIATLDGTPQYSVTAASNGVATVSGVTTTNTSDLVFADCLGVDSFCTAGAGYTGRNDANTYNAGNGSYGHSFYDYTGQLLEDKVGVSAGTQSATFGTGTSTDNVILGLLALTTNAVQAPPAITSATATSFTIGTAGSFTVTSTGTPAPSLTETGTLPSGVTFVNNGNGTATLGGTPAAGTAGNYPMTITANNGVGSAATQSFTLTVNQIPAITSANTTTFAVGTAGNFTVTTTGSPTPFLTATGTLPSGVTFVNNGDGTATLIGTPASGSGGTYPLTFTANNGAGTPASQSFTLKVNQAPAITSAASTTFTLGTAGSFTVTTTGTPVSTVAETGTLPNGVSFINKGNGTATLSGTPASGSAGTYSLTFTASNGVGSPANQSFTLTVNTAQLAPAITSANNTTFTAGTAGSFTVATTGSPTPSVTETGALPNGVTFGNNGNGTATLSGTPAAGTGGTYSLTFTASNGVGSPASQSFTLKVNQAPTITSANTGTFVAGSAGSFTVTTTGTPTPSLTEVGALPSGVTFVNNGNGTATLSGTPAAGMGGTYTLTFTASNGVGSPATQSFSLKVNQAPAITSANSTTFTVGTAGSFTVTTTGNPLAVVTETGALPSGVSFVNNGNGTATLSGTPASGSGGTYVVTLTANNGVGTAATQSFTLTVNGGGGGGGSSNFAYVTGSITGVIDSSGSSSKTLAVALHQNPGAGHLLICAGTWQSATATATMSDPNNGVWTAIGTAKTGVGSLGGYRGQMFYVLSAVNASTTVTLTISSAAVFRAFECAEYSYSGTIATLDGTPQYSVTAASNGVATVSGVTTTNTSDLVFADCLGVDSFCTAGAGYTGRNDANTYNAGNGSYGHSFYDYTGQLLEDKVGVSAGTQSATFGTGTSTDNVILGLIAF